MLWLALHLPALPLEAFCASLPLAANGTPDTPGAPGEPGEPGTTAKPVVLLHQHTVHSANAAALDRGIHPGIKRATALALAADLVVGDSDPTREAAAVQAVVHAALVFTPAVCLHSHVPACGPTLTPAQAPAPSNDPEGPTVLLEVQASLRLFGGLTRLRQLLLQALLPLGHRVQMAAAPTALGAALLSQLAASENPQDAERWVLGRHATDLQALHALLGRAPVLLLPACRPHARVLQALGVDTVAALQALPRDGVARRFGPAVLDELDRARGEQSDPRRWLVPPPAFNSRLELYAHAESTSQVLHGAGVLLARLVAWAQSRHGRVAGFTLRMLHERRRSPDLGEPCAATELHVPLAEPALDLAHLQLLLRERLAHCMLAAPTLELQLLCSQLVAAPAPNGELFPTPSSRAEGLVRLLEQLCARLGTEQVHRVLPVADFRPERAYVTVPAQQPLAPVLAATAAAAAVAVADRNPHGAPPLPLHRPTWLLPEPLPLAERDAMPLLQGRPLRLVSGPERIETGWWDGAMVARDCFIAMAEDGSLLWVFRDRLPTLSGEVHWFLQGRFG
jgi:protein ImuB